MSDPTNTRYRKNNNFYIYLIVIGVICVFSITSVIITSHYYFRFLCEQNAQLLSKLRVVENSTSIIINSVQNNNYLISSVMSNALMLEQKIKNLNDSINNRQRHYYSYSSIVGTNDIHLPLDFGKPLNFKCNANIVSQCHAYSYGFGSNITLQKGIYLVGWSLECVANTQVENIIIVTIKMSSASYSTTLVPQLTHGLGTQYTYCGTNNIVSEINGLVEFNWLITPTLMSVKRCQSSMWVTLIN